MHGRSGARIQVDHDDDDAEEEEDRGIVVAGRRREGRKAGVAGGYATATMASTPDIRTLATVGNSRRSGSDRRHRRLGTPCQ